jgi:predicted deacetylase
MRQVILRDDDTNALTPIECLERLYRPFLDRGLPVNLATIPEVSTRVTFPDGRPEGFLWNQSESMAGTTPIASNQKLTGYLLDNPGFHIVQHGLHHDYFEFDRDDSPEICRRLERGTRLLRDAGFPHPAAFVAPYDKFSKVSLVETAKRFPVVSSGWYERRRLPRSWWPRYFLKKIFRASHWRMGNTVLLSHPGCLLSCHRPRETMLQTVKDAVENSQLTVLVTHWWEYFRDSRPDELFIRQLHETAAYLANDPAIRVISFGDLAQGSSQYCGRVVSPLKHSD